jgi:hypothetical protein
VSWYLSVILIETLQGKQSCNVLFERQSDDSAFEAAAQKNFTFGSNLGILDMVLLSEPPADESEILWRQFDDNNAEEKNLTSVPMRAGSAVNWYIAGVLYKEIHLNHPHDDHSFLYWEILYLLNSTNIQEAWGKAIDFGHESASAYGEHKCDGDSARWVFTGLTQIVPLANAPEDGALLWCESTTADKVPARQDTSLLQWRRSRKSEVHNVN